MRKKISISNFIKIEEYFGSQLTVKRKQFFGIVLIKNGGGNKLLHLAAGVSRIARRMPAVIFAWNEKKIYFQSPYIYVVNELSKSQKKGWHHNNFRNQTKKWSFFKKKTFYLCNKDCFETIFHCRILGFKMIGDTEANKLVFEFISKIVPPPLPQISEDCKKFSEPPNQDKSSSYFHRNSSTPTWS